LNINNAAYIFTKPVRLERLLLW